MDNSSSRWKIGLPQAEESVLLDPLGMLSPLPTEMTPHSLCTNCSQLIANSRIIQEFLGNAEPEDAYAAWKKSKRGPRTEVIPEAYASQFLARSSIEGCHICSILWHRLPANALKLGYEFLDVTVVENRSVDYVSMSFETTGYIISNATTGPSSIRILLKKYRGIVSFPVGLLSPVLIFIS